VVTTPATRTEWLIFLALGFMWGSSYLFIKLAVDSFGTFMLIALRLIIGAALLWLALLVTRGGPDRDPAWP
jgi:drug/metabolite transporter (DMT)-like permease